MRAMRPVAAVVAVATVAATVLAGAWRTAPVPAPTTDRDRLAILGAADAQRADELREQLAGITVPDRELELVSDGGWEAAVAVCLRERGVTPRLLEQGSVQFAGADARGVALLRYECVERFITRARVDAVYGPAEWQRYWAYQATVLQPCLHQAGVPVTVPPFERFLADVEAAGATDPRQAGVWNASTGRAGQLPPGLSARCPAFPEWV